MAFRFNWPEFDTQFYNEAKSQLEAALNKGNKPKNIVDYISVTELNMGTIAPDLEILEIGELSTDKFRGIFKLTYCGDASIVIQTKVQANPMHAKESDLPRHTKPSVLAADQPLVVPMLLKISDLKLRGIVVLVVSKTKGITLVFKNDPLESILVSSTFDSVTSVRSFLQREIEKQLRNLFQEDLPVMIHNLSLRHIQSEQEKLQNQTRQQKRAEFLKSNRSVFSDPGQRRPNSFSTSSIHSPFNHARPQFDTFSMPDLASSPKSFATYLNDSQQTPPSFLSTSPMNYNSFSDLYYLNQQQEYIPMTAESLSGLNSWNQLYSSRFAALKTPTSNPLSDGKTYVDYDDEEEEDLSSFIDENASSVNSMIAAEIYADNEDAPWYVTDGPELPTSFNSNMPLTIGEEDIIIDPKANAVAGKLAQLATINHTISPFTHTINHFTFRSLPHTVKVDAKSKNKKKPKRRIIRLNTNNLGY